MGNGVASRALLPCSVQGLSAEVEMIAVRALYSVSALDRISGTTRWYKKPKRVLCNLLLNKEHILFVECPTLSAIFA